MIRQEIIGYVRPDLAGAVVDDWHRSPSGFDERPARFAHGAE
jgi:hypothetical protein